jgi:hypothetical protein
MMGSSDHLCLGEDPVVRKVHRFCQDGKVVNLEAVPNGGRTSECP